MKRVVAWMGALALLIPLASQADEPAPGKAYLFTFFREPNGQDGLHLAWSRDARKWTELGPAEHAWIVPNPQHRCMRDPCLRQGPDGTFHLVWTTGWSGKGFGYASSRDLVHWTPQRFIPVNEKIEGAENTWAPELFYDARNERWLIFWATTVAGRFPETAGQSDHNHRQYYVTTQDFQTFSETKLFFDPGHNVIDATLFETGGKYYLVYKDERPGKKQLHLVSSDSAEGPWSEPSPALPKPGKMVEGPTVLPVGDAFHVYFDVYSDGKYGAVRSRDLVQWEDITPQLATPKEFRHGTAIEVSEAILQGLLAAVKPQQAAIDVQVDRPGVAISPTLWGIFFEEINLAGDGGLYAELVRNRSLEEAEDPKQWTLISGGSAQGEIAVDTDKPMSPKNPRSLRVRVSGGEGFVGAANEGYFGIPVAKDAAYALSLAARAGAGFSGALVARLESADGAHVYAQQRLEGIGPEWKTFRATLTPSTTDPHAKLVVGTSQKGTVWLDMISLFPQQTWKGRPGGLRPDLAEMLSGLKPAFVRFPGGCWVEGDVLQWASRWKRTLGDPADRWTQWNLWQYHSTNGLGYHEYLVLCEDLGAEPLFVINCGMSHKEVVPLDQMAEWVQDALDAIEYANGPADSPMGALRAAAGHPEPFNMKYIEIGNENGGTPYQERYPLFHDAIRARYPKMTLIADVPTERRPADVIDEHYYSNPQFFLSNAAKYDSYDRKGPKIYVGEYAVTQDCGAGNLRGALAEAAFMTGMERNSDVVVMASYAPLFANVRYKRWNPNLINFDGTRVFGTPSYYVQQLFAQNRGDVVLPSEIRRVDPETAQRYPGAVGVGTWATQAEYKDLRVTQGDRVLAACDFAKGTEGWQLGTGQWKAEEGCLAQAATGTDCRAVTGDSQWSDYTYTLKARKTGGDEGFLILFQVRDQNNWLWWNLGGWGNQRHAIEQCVGGSKSQLGPSVPGAIETGRWYDIRIETSAAAIRCYLDGKLVHEVRHGAMQRLHAAASRDRATGEVILKVVNAGDRVVETDVNLAGVKKVAAEGKAFVLTSGSDSDENTLEAPTRVATREMPLAAGTRFRHAFPAHSLTVLRVPAE